MDSDRNGFHSSMPGASPRTTSANEPIAMIGIGCRLPGGANSPDQFWQLLTDGVDAIREIPADRWDVRAYYDPEPGRPGKTNARWGGFIDNIDKFDAAFFGISPREAVRMDPQQRLVLEVAWEAIEDAGLPLHHLSGTNTAVFVGVSSYDYAGMQVSYRDRSGIDVYSNTGGAFSIVANRISYVLDLRGPSAIVDTACSSALVATHLACEAIWRDGCSMALAGGVNALFSPDGFIGFSRLSMLSPDGRCKAFDADGKGFVRSEGAGIVVLKPLSQAVADGDRIYAVIRATGSNQDGKTAGMTVPSQHSQEELLRVVHRRAGINPRWVRYMEAHGTGTPVGDPIEARALGAVLAQGRPPDEPCLVGSVKSNIGHLESASGIAGLIKAALVLKHRKVPPNLHFNTPHPDIPFSDLKLQVPTTTIPLPKSPGEPIMAGVNSFGFGGTNAHVLLEEPPVTHEFTSTEHELNSRNGDAHPVDPLRLFPFSARSAETLPSVAAVYEEWLKSSDIDLNDLQHNLARRRTHHEHRLAILARNHNELLETLAAARAGDAHPNIATGRVLAADAPGLVWVFSGQGPQWWGMGRQLLEKEPVFRAVIEQCDQLIRSMGEWSLLEELTRDESTSRIQETAIAQPAIFAIQAGLAALWSSWGIKPSAIVGHSVGEVAAAHAAGVLSLEDAVKVIFHRGRCMDFAAAGGRMLAVGMPLDEAQTLLAPYGDRVTVAAINGPSSLTLSGESAALEEIAKSLEPRQVFHRFLQVRYAFHSAQMEPAREPLLHSLAGIRPQPAHTALYSTVTAEAVVGPEWGADYWWQNVRRPVRFAEVIDKLIEIGHRVVLEIAPHPVLSGPILECCRHRSASGQTFPSLRRNEDEQGTMGRTLAGLYTRGASLDWEQLAPYGRTLRLPTYPWQHERYWREAEESGETRITSSGRHPLLGRKLYAAVPGWESRIGTRIDPYLADHCVQGHPLLPATAYLETALSAARAVFPNGPYSLEEVRFAKACFLDNGVERALQTIFNPVDSSFQIASRDPIAGGAWTQHATGFLRSRPHESPRPLEVAEVQQRCHLEVSREDSYATLTQMGLEYGPMFQGIERLWRGDGEALGKVALPDALRSSADDYLIHPALLDACLQVILAAVPAQPGAAREVYLPVEVAEVRFHARPGSRVWSHARLVERSRIGLTVDLQVFDETGRPVWEARGLRCQSLGAESTQGQSLDELLYAMRWALKPRPGTGPRIRVAPSLPVPSDVAAAVRPVAARLVARQSLAESYESLQQTIDQVCAGYVWQALQELAGSSGLPEQFAADELFATLGIEARHRRLFDRYLLWLERDGIVQREANGWRIVGKPTCDDPEAVWRETLIQQPRNFIEITLIGRCSRNLAQVLRGEVNPLHLLFGEGTATGAEQLYSDSPVMQHYNLVARAAVERLAAKIPDGRVLRILEVGAGTGGLTVHVLPVLPADRTEYLYTDVTSAFFRKAGDRFREFPFVQYRTLDLEKDPVEQGFAEHSFDLILASQVLHATADLKATLGHLRRLLSSDGQVLMIEGVIERRWIDLVFGLIEGWWRFTDTDVRQNHPLLTVPRWQELLHQVGFVESTDVSRQDDETSIGHSVILARGPQLERAGVMEPLQSVEDTRSECELSNPAWLIFADRTGIADRLASALRAQGDSCVLVHVGDPGSNGEAGHLQALPLQPESLRKVLQQVRAPRRGVVYLWGLDAPAGEELSTEELLNAQTEVGMGLVHLVQAWNDLIEDERRLWVITRGANGPTRPGQPLSMVQSSLIGLRRVLRNEFPKLPSALIDLAGINDEAEVQALIWEFMAPDDEDELAFCGETRYVPRYEHRTLRPQSGHSADRDIPYRLEVARNNTIDGLSLKPVARREPGPGEVELKVCAAGLNFSDVMKALGLYPGLPDGPVPLGIECSGVVTAVGPGVTDMKVGDEVVAVGPFCFSAYVTIPAGITAPKPLHLSHEEAATLPVAYLTAHYALNYLGRIQRGERVLIHSAAGGVGMAAVQLAHEAGAEVFATAGTAEKREVLAGMGVKHIMDSRTLSFADEVMRLTDGRGVDLVLNSLSGEAIGKSLSVVGEYGRFLEIGKRDIYNNSRIGLFPFRKNLSFMAIDLDRAMRERPALVAGQLREVLSRVRPGQLAALPHRVYPIGRAAEAFRFMAQGKHLGKIVLSMQSHEAPVIASDGETDPTIVRADGSYLVTGGLGGFGFTVARWLVQQGARHLILMGRSGAATPEAQAAVKSLEELGANVMVARADVSIAADVARVLSDAAATMPPLHGVVHAAMVLDDCVALKLNEERWRKVLAPKSGGAWNLHQQTRDLPLDFFVCFSSMSAVFGVGGQANYAAANTALDVLSRYRNAQGQPGLSVHWGYVGEVGYVARNEKIGERFESWGVRGFSPAQALQIMGHLIHQRTDEAGVMNVNWAKFRPPGISNFIPPRFIGLVQSQAANEATGDGVPSRQALLSVEGDARRELMQSMLREKVARVLGCPAAKLDVQKPLTELGLDSLMAVELRNWAEGELRVSLPMVELMHGPSVMRLGDLLLEQLNKSEGGSAPVVPTPEPLPTAAPLADANGQRTEKVTEEVREQVAQLSDDEVDRMLSTMLTDGGETRG